MRTELYKVIFYQTRNKDCPVDDFLDPMNMKHRAEFLLWLEQFEIQGPNLKRPYADIVKGKIRELRILFGSNTYRIFYFFFIRNMIILTHGLVKKSNEIPTCEIERAENYNHDFINRYNKGEIVL